MYMRIDPVQNVIHQPEVQAEKPKERVAEETRPVAESRFSASKQASALPVNTPKYEVTVQYDANQILVTKFIDQKSGEIVQQIPPDQMLKIIESIQELLKESAQTRVLDTFR
jgi:uncharacterized FlaG/YvyC family protein